VVSAADPPRSLILVFYTGAATFLSSSSSFTLTRAEWISFQTHCYSENVVVPGVAPGTSIRKYLLAFTDLRYSTISVGFKSHVQGDYEEQYFTSPHAPHGRVDGAVFVSPKRG
jgi:hypothetical protein